MQAPINEKLSNIQNSDKPTVLISKKVKEKHLMSEQKSKKNQSNPSQTNKKNSSHQKNNNQIHINQSTTPLHPKTLKINRIKSHNTLSRVS